MIDALDENGNFQTTHSVIRKLNKQSEWNYAPINKLLKIALNNHPVRYVLTDADVKHFYKKIVNSASKETDDLKEIKDLLK